ncbi:methylcytosine dioxygenase TET1 [Cricetulus griseus]|uniref:methylcytosine dioxygenase TET1 n=1 Tax=Cricetulus griseus TaxID=10029 RepID=UPI00022F43E3|nr:methylcytosine dioxygenase TET1 [Cricetulus griseus]
MPRSSNAKPSKSVRIDLHKKEISLKKTLKQSAKHKLSGKMNSGKLKELIQRRDVKKETEDKTSTPSRSLLTRAGAARMNEDSTQDLFQNPESLTCKGFTMALRRTSLSRRLSQCPVVTSKPKKAPPSKSVSKPQCNPNTQDDKVERSENDSVPSQDPIMSPDTENLIDEESLCLVEDEIQEITQSWPQRVEESQRCPSTYESPATDMLSGPPEGTLCEGLLSPQTSGDVNTSPQDCAPLPQGSTPEVTPQKNTSNQVEDLGSQVESLKLPEPSPIPIGNGHNCFPTSSFKMLPELDLKNCMSLDGSIYPTALIKFLLAGSQPDILGAKPQEEETLKTNPDQGGCCPDQFLDATSVLGQAFGTFPPQWELPGANLVPGEVLDKVSDSPDLGAITLVNQQETLNVDMGTSSDLPIFLPNPSNTVATYSTLPPGPEPHNYASCGLEVQGAIPILTLDSGFAPQPPPNSELSSIPPVIATNSIQDKKQLCANPSPANTQGFTIASENGLQNAPLDLTRGSQTAPSKLEGGMISQVNMPSSADVKTTGMSTPVTQASASSLSHKPTSPTVEKKKRKPCGVCEPCQQKTNCGECTYCKNRKNSHQICKKRKCEVLKKRPDATSGVQVTKENKRPQRETKPKVSKRDDNKSVNGPKPESMAYSQCGHGEEGHRLDWIAHPLENVGKNTKSMTAIEVGQWTPTKRAHFSGQVKGDLDANLTEVVSSQSFEEDRQETKPSPMFAQTMRNVIKNVHCLPADTNLLINKLDLQEISKVLGNTSKFPTNSANCKDVMSSITADGCDQLKDTNNIFLFQKPDLNCQSGVNSTNFNHPTTHSAASQPQTPDKVHSKEPKEDSPVQPSLLSIIKDRRLTLEQVVAIEALTQLSEAPSENSSPSKSEKDEKTDQTTASLLHSCKALLNYVRKDLQDPNSQGKCLQHPDTVVFNGQITTIKLLDSSATNQELENSCGHANTLKEGRKCIAGGKLTIVKDAHYTEIEEDVAAQLTQLASHINLTTAESKNAECPLGSLVSKTIQEKGIVQQKPPSDILTKPSIPIAKPKNKTRKKAKTTPKTDKPKKEPLVSLSSQENDKQEQFATKYSKMHDIWMSCKFQRFGQSGPHDVPLLLGNIPTFEEILTPVVHSRDILGLKNNTLFPPVSQIQFRRYSESAKEEVKVEPQESLPSCQFKTESSRQVFADLADRAQVEPRENISEKAQPLPQPSPPSNQCANMPGADKTQFHLCAQENLVHQIPPSLPGTSPDTPFPELLSILSKDNVTNSNGITLGMAKWELQTPSNGPLGDSITHSAQTDFNETIRNCLREPATLLLPGANEEKDSVLEGPPCDCKGEYQTDKGPYYTHLGAGPSVAAIRELMETRYCEKGKAIRIEKIEYMGKESKSSRGCPVVKTVLRQNNDDEKVLCLARERVGHHCQTAVMVVGIVLWQPISPPLADHLYDEITDNLRSYSGHPTDRRCTFNEKRTCTCQGLNPRTCGASFSFGCSWSMYLNGCKFGRSPNPRKFKLAPNYPLNEKKIEGILNKVADTLAPIYKQMAPVAYQNQVKYEDVAADCRLGTKKGRPFSGVTCCMDFCAHSHKDNHNMINGSTVVLTLLRKDARDRNNLQDEQFHVLPLHRLADTDEFGSREGMEAKIRSGAIEIIKPSVKKLLHFNEPIPRCGKRRTTMKEHNKNPATTLKNYSSACSTPHPVKAESADLCPPKPSYLETATCMYNSAASGGFPETSSIVHCTVPSGTHGGAYENGECAGIERPGKVAPLPHTSLPIADSLVDAEPVTSPSEHPQLPFLSCPRELEHCAADEPLSDDLSSDEIIITQTEFLSDSEEIYYDPCFGGVAIALTHGSVLIEYARGELHATTPLTIPNRSYPIRTSLVLYQHKNMNVPNHGFDLCRIKCKPRDLRKKKPVDPEGPDLSIEANLLRTIPSRIASTLTHDNVVTVSPYAFTHIAGPYNHWV